MLAAYPQSFRHEQEEEMLAVLMAGARPGQRRPGLAEAADVIASGLRMRLRRARPGPASQARAGELTAFSVAAPLLVLVAGLLAVAVPYHLPPANRALALLGWPAAPRELGGLPLLRLPGFDIAAGGQVIIAAVVLLGLRRLALAAVAPAAAGFWIAAARYGIPEPLWVLGAAACPLEAAALIAAPGYRRGRRLLRWHEGIALLIAAAVQALTLTSDARSELAWTGVLLRGYRPLRDLGRTCASPVSPDTWS